MDDIKFDKRNYRKHSDKNKAMISKSLSECGAGRSILIDSEGEIIAGNGVYEQAKAKGIPVRVVETDGSELVVVKRTDLKTEDEKRKKLALADNATSDRVEWDMGTIAVDFDDCELSEWGIETKKKDEDEQEGEQKITEVLNEEHNYIVLYYDNEVDWLQAQSLFGIERVRDFPDKKRKIFNKRMGLGRLINGVKALESIKNAEL